MTTYNNASLLSDLISPSFVQAATAPEMQSLMTAALAAIADAGAGNVIGITLAGAGDGHTFVTDIQVSSESSFYEASNLRVGCYLAGTAEELAVARTSVLAALLAETPPFGGAVLDLIDEMLVGSSKGTQFMGMIVAFWTPGEGGG